MKREEGLHEKRVLYDKCGCEIGEKKQSSRSGSPLVTATALLGERRGIPFLSQADSGIRPSLPCRFSSARVCCDPIAQCFVFQPQDNPRSAPSLKLSTGQATASKCCPYFFETDVGVVNRRQEAGLRAQRLLLTTMRGGCPRDRKPWTPGQPGRLPPGPGKVYFPYPRRSQPRTRRPLGPAIGISGCVSLVARKLRRRRGTPPPAPLSPMWKVRGQGRVAAHVSTCTVPSSAGSCAAPRERPLPWDCSVEGTTNRPVAFCSSRVSG